MAEKTYSDQLQEKVELLRKKLQKIEAAKGFGDTPEGAIIVEHIQSEVNRLFKDMTSGEPLDRETYLVAHSAISLYRGMLKAIVNTADNEARVKKELEDETKRIRARQSEQPAA